MSGMIELTAYSGKFLGPIAKVLGWIMSGIYDIVLKISGGTINSVPLAIVLMTILIYMCLLPLTIQQQKFSKLSQKMQPELNAIRDKYKNRKDQEAMMAMNQETQLVYQKYGISPSGSCIQMLIQTITDFLNRRLKLFPVTVEPTGHQATLFASKFGDEKIFRHCHTGSRTHLRILKDARQVLSPLFR